MKHIDVKPDSSAECNVDSNEKDPKFEIGSRVRISKYKKKLPKDILQIGHKKLL